MKKMKETPQICEEEERMGSEMEELFKTLPKEKIPDGIDLYLYEGHWYPSQFIQGIILFHQRIIAQDTDMIIVTLPKSGTTWLKALAFTIENRNNYPLSKSPLLTTSPHILVPFLKIDFYGKNPILKLEDIPSRRILATHVLPGSYPERPISTGSFRHILRGYTWIWAVLGSWVEVLEGEPRETRQSVFLNYEDMKEDTISQLKEMAKFMDFPFSVEEESEGIIEEVSKQF
ncbi:hypothetical protein ACSBR1_031250 [Camellia fascicularis]